MIRVAAIVSALLAAMWSMTPSLAAETPPKISGWDIISITQEAKVGTSKRAILIANSTYKYLKPLSAPPHDVEAMSSQLSQLGFATTILQNPTYYEIFEVIATASQNGSRGSLLALYYSGHAAMIDGENSLLLTGFHWDGGRYDNQRVPLQLVLSLLADANFEKVFVAFDACRKAVDQEDTKSAQQGTKPILTDGIRGLARTDSDFEGLASKEYAVLFSTSHGEYALDSTVNGLSPFTEAFLLALARETSFLKAMLLTKEITWTNTKHAQSPDLQIKWNSDLTYARSSAVTNSAAYELNNQITAGEFSASPIDLPKITTFGPGLYINPRTQKAIVAANRFMQLFGDKSSQTQAPPENPPNEQSRGLAILNLKDDDFERCQSDVYKPFFWHSDIASVELCYLMQLGHKSAATGKMVFSEEGGAIYNTAKYHEALWSFDLDFDGSLEKMRASLRNSDMALTVTSKTSEFEFRGLIGPNIEFIGLHDFNKDGILDVYIVYSMSDYTRGSELIILDGRKIAKGLEKVKRCASEESAATMICKHLTKIRSQMTGSLFTYDIDKGYYPADILQIALYADWNIKHWLIDEDGALHLTTYSATWPYERNQPSNYTMDKLVAYDPATGKLNISMSGQGQRSISIAPVAAQIVEGAEFNATPDPKTVIETLK